MKDAFIRSYISTHTNHPPHTNTNARNQTHQPGKTVEELRLCLNIESDFTPEEDAQVRKENAWCEEAAA